MGRPPKQTAAEKAAAKTAAVEAAKEQPKVDPLDRDIFKSVMSILDEVSFKGSDVALVVAMRAELARVAGL